MRGDIMRGVVLAVLAGTLIACSTASPIRLHGRPVGELAAPTLDGVYRATVVAPMMGPVSGIIIAEPTKDGFKANTRPGVAWSMIGGIEGLLGPIFAPSVFPGGVILTWNANQDAEAGETEGWISAGTIRNAGLATRMQTPASGIELADKDGRTVGFMRLAPATGDEPPMADYAALVEQVKIAMDARLFDADLVDSRQVRRYYAHLERVATLARDDIEFIFGAGAAAFRHINFPLPLVLKKDDDAARERVNLEAPDLETIKLEFDEESRIATFKPDLFLEADDVDDAFERIMSWNPAGLIIDLTGVPGVTLASLRTASWVVSEPTEAGVFFGAEHRKDGIAGRTDHFPRVAIDSVASVAELDHMLDTVGAAQVTIHPAANPYRGPVALLINDKTLTSAEPLAWVLRYATEARVYGRSTAGKPQISRPADIGQDWVVWVPVADYRPPTGERIDRGGVHAEFIDRDRGRAREAAEAWLRGQ